jgi:hypothetical protein
MTPRLQRVLVVEDDPSIQAIAKMSLEMVGASGSDCMDDELTRRLEEQMEEVKRSFVDGLPGRLAEIEEGWRSFDGGDTETRAALHRHAHSLRGRRRRWASRRWPRSRASSSSRSPRPSRGA